MRAAKTAGQYIYLISLVLLLLSLGGLGYLAPQEFAAYGLVLTTVAAGTASFFSPVTSPSCPATSPSPGGERTRSPGRDFGRPLPADS